MDTTQFWTDYRTLVAKLLRPIAPGNGCPEQEMVEAEQRLGTPLPQVLREYYLLVGRRADINKSFEQLLSPSELRVEGDVLVFFDENQIVCMWGVAGDNLNKPDPPVIRAFLDTELIWEPHQESLSSFFVEMLLIQCVNGAMTYTAIGDIDADSLKQIGVDWERIETGGSYALQWMMREGQLVFFGNRSDTVDSKAKLHISAGASAHSDLEGLSSFGAMWSDVFEAEE